MNSVSLYQKKLRKQLPCKNAVKKRLLENFQASLDEFLEDHPSPTIEELDTAFGPPEEMVKILSAEISQEDVARYRKGCKIKRILSVVLAVVVTASVLYLAFWKQKPITQTDDLEINDEISIDDTTGGK